MNGPNHTWKKYRGKEVYDKINKIFFDVGGFMRSNFEVKIDLQSEQVDLQIFDFEDDNSLKSVITLTEESIEWFRKELYKCDFVNWAEEYVEYVLDGTHWGIRIEYDTYCEIKTGSNHYPPKWTIFCKAISKLCGTDIY